MPSPYDTFGNPHLQGGNFYTRERLNKVATSREAARTLALYWQRSINPMPVYVARDETGAVIAWSRSRSEAFRRSPGRASCERETQA